MRPTRPGFLFLLTLVRHYAVKTNYNYIRISSEKGWMFVIQYQKELIGLDMYLEALHWVGDGEEEEQTLVLRINHSSHNYSSFVLILQIFPIRHITVP